MEDRIEPYVKALCTELRMLADWQRAAGNTSGAPDFALPDGAALRPSIFFGGGTPGMLTPAQLERILQSARVLVPLEGAEVTIEANPGTLLGVDMHALHYFQAVRALGINRLSLGVQSLHDPTLRVLGRSHTAAEAYECFGLARRAGFDSINLDFIFGLPGQTVEQWQHTLETVTTWGADHFSLYSLILEESTPLYAQVTGGRVHLPDDDTTAVMYEQAMTHFAAAGYSQYEISNWARTGEHEPLPAHACAHNLAYWLNRDYLAAGAGAHGHRYPRRYYNVAPIDTYIAKIDSGQRPIADIIDLAPDDLCAETMFMGLRLNIGVTWAHFRTRCGADMTTIYGSRLHKLQAQGLLEQDVQGVRLTRRGRMLGNQVFSHFVA
jgi:oxygen-independent coproporphyrinogen-3 oxidase